MPGPKDIQVTFKPDVEFSTIAVTSTLCTLGGKVEEGNGVGSADTVMYCLEVLVRSCESLAVGAGVCVGSEVLPLEQGIARALASTGPVVYVKAEGYQCMYRPFS